MNHYLKLFNTALVLFFVFFIFSVFFSSVTHAQLEGRTTDSLILLIDPENPDPFSQVTIAVDNNLIDLSRATIIWRQNGKEIGRGTGLKKITTTTGKAGSQSTIEVTVIDTNGNTRKSQKIIRPAALDLLWEAETTTPPFYKGKALPSSESVVKLTAFPFFSSGGQVFTPGELFYKWYIGSKFMSDYSGKGKSSFRVISPQTGSKAEIKVIVSSPGESIVAEKKVTLKPTQPEILFYEETPFTGPKTEKILPNKIILTEKEYSLWAGVYNFSLNDILTYTWSQNDKNISTNKDTVTFAKKEVGTSKINLSVKSKNNLLQFGKKELIIEQQ